MIFFSFFFFFLLLFAFALLFLRAGIMILSSSLLLSSVFRRRLWRLPRDSRRFQEAQTLKEKRFQVRQGGHPRHGDFGPVGGFAVVPSKGHQDFKDEAEGLKEEFDCKVLGIFKRKTRFYPFPFSLFPFLFPFPFPFPFL